MGDSKGPRTNILLSWAMVISSIVSCCSRADYNIAIGFLVLMLRSLTSTEKLKLGTKGVIHIILLSLIFDIIYNSIYWLLDSWRGFIRFVEIFIFSP